ncbi:hypothetical protein D082_35170 [Synechocystis sp. PCC 6714]|nr:hypothetical protein D082_35170 [Synechocystis sp. PCC 6714]
MAIIKNLNPIQQYQCKGLWRGTRLDLKNCSIPQIIPI